MKETGFEPDLSHFKAFYFLPPCYSGTQTIPIRYHQVPSSLFIIYSDNCLTWDSGQCFYLCLIRGRVKSVKYDFSFSFDSVKPSLPPSSLEEEKGIHKRTVTAWSYLLTLA